MSEGEQRLLEMCIGLLTDMVENQVLQFFLTMQIMRRKFPKIAASLANKVKSGNYSFGYADLLATVRNELYDLNLDECYFSFSTKIDKMSIEESDAF